MFKILAKDTIAPRVTRLTVEAPEVARRALAGQFVILRLDEQGERIPLTIAGRDPARGTITLIFQEVGKTTTALGRRAVGESILDLVGPLGRPTEISRVGTVVCVAGGVGVPEAVPVARAFTEAGNRVIGIIGARTKELVILEREMKEATHELLVATDDGTAGQKGFVTDLLEKIIARPTPVDLVYAIGPVPMMKAVAAVTAARRIRTVVSLNPIMVDGTGMCGSCRVTVGGKTRFACVEGPEFDAHEVDWNELITRLSLFKKEEKVVFDHFITECACKKDRK